MPAATRRHHWHGARRPRLYLPGFGRFWRRPLCRKNLSRKTYPGHGSAATSSVGRPAEGAQLHWRSMDSAFISADNRRSDLESRRRPPGRSPEAQSGKRERSDMTTKSRLYLGVAALAVVLTGSVVEVSAQQSAPTTVAID